MTEGGMTEGGMTEDGTTARAVVARMRETEGPSARYDMRLDDVGPGHASLSMRITPECLNGFGSAHGGILFLLADTAFAYACNSRDAASVAQAVSIVFLSPGRNGERVTAAARELALVGRSGVYQVEITGEDGRMIANFQGASRTLGGTVLTEEKEMSIG